MGIEVRFSPMGWAGVWGAGLSAQRQHRLLGAVTLRNHLIRTWVGNGHSYHHPSPFQASQEASVGAQTLSTPHATRQPDLHQNDLL